MTIVMLLPVKGRKVSLVSVFLLSFGFLSLEARDVTRNFTES